MGTPDRPNVLWFVMEDVGTQLGCYGDDVARTPTIDDLASEGRRFANAFSPAGVCAPARASLQTGLYPHQVGANHMRTDTRNVDGLPESYDAVPPHYVTGFTESLRQAGYYCTLNWKADYQFGEPSTMWDRHDDEAGWWDDARDADQPFFAMLTNGVTHESGMWHPDQRDDQFGGAVPDPETDPEAVQVPPYLPDTERTRTAIARFYDNLERSDAWIGECLDRLEADCHAEDTVVVVTADHGYGIPRNKRWPYDSGTHVPLIVRWPGETDGEVVEDLVTLLDLPATALSLAGLDVPRWMNGRPIVGEDATGREYVVATRDRYDESYDMVRSIRDERFRYVRHYYSDRPYVLHIPYRNSHPAMQELLRLDAEGGLDPIQQQWMANSRPAEELYDIENDPHEVNNLADDPEYRDVLERMRDALDDWRDRTDDRRIAAEPEAEMRRRNWPEGDQPETAPPQFVPNAPENRGRETVSGEVTLSGPATIDLYCPTQGASMAYTTESDEEPHWRIYDGPLHLQSGESAAIRAKAVRYGFAESEESSVTVDVTE